MYEKQEREGHLVSCMNWDFTPHRRFDWKMTAIIFNHLLLQLFDNFDEPDLSD